MENLEYALQQVRAVKQLVSTPREPHTLYLAYRALQRYIPSVIKATKPSTIGNKDDAAVCEVRNCLSVFKEKYVQSMEKMLDQAESGELEKTEKNDADILLEDEPGKKASLIEMRKYEIANFEAMWILYDTIKSEKNQRASDYHKKLLFDINKRILAYLESK